MTFGAASTGTAISSLSGAAATNATLAALGGGAIDSSIFAGGMALGSTVLTGATLGVGLMVGGFVINSTGKKLSNQADEAYQQAKKTEEEVEEVCQYLNSLTYYGAKFKKSLLVVSEAYKKRLWKLDFTVNHEKKTNWNDFTEQEKLLTQNTQALEEIMDIFQKSSKRVKKIVLLEILGLLYSDETYDDDEKKFVAEYGLKVGVSKEEIDMITFHIKRYLDVVK